MVRTWNGRRRIAFIPVWNRQVDSEPPADWTEQVRARAFYDPDPATGIDRSLQRYIQTVSSGKAFIEGRVFPTVASEDADTVGVGLRSLPPAHDYDFAIVVLPHAMGSDRSGFAWMNEQPVNGIRDFGRVAMFTDQFMNQPQNIGVWAMELLHIVTHLDDLYNVSPQLGRYDIMACNCGTHPSAHTKSLFGWLNPGAIRTHIFDTDVSYTLHAVSMPQPPPYWRTTAVQIKQRGTPGHLIVEARIGNDLYDGSSTISQGIPLGDGVIVYEVLGDTQVYLRTPSPLRPGDQFEDPAERLTVRVTGAVADGFAVRVISEGFDRCTQLAEQIKLLQVQIDLETDVTIRKQLISQLVKAQAEYRSLHCLVLVNPPTELFEPPRS